MMLRSVLISSSLDLKLTEPNSASAKRRLPVGTCDAHFHFFDAAQFPYAATRAYTPPDATMANYATMCRRFGIDRAVLVQPSVFGADHSSMEHALAQHRHWLRGVAVVYPDTSEAQIARWHALGVRGTRINNLHTGGPSLADLRRIVDKTAPFGWHVQLLIDLAEHPHLPGAVCDMGVSVVVDHIGHHPPLALARSVGFANLLSLVQASAAWVKLSGPYRSSAQVPHYPDSCRLVESLLAANPRNLVWGTDWPHPPAQYPIPSDAALVELVDRWLPDAALRQAVLVDNATRLYWG